MIALTNILAASAFVAALAVSSLPAQEQAPATSLAHTQVKFHFVVNAPLEQAAPLFGAWEERKWAPEWSPQFLYPNPPHDQQGMVFQATHGAFTSTWVNTTFDLAGGHIQYAYVIPDGMATNLDIQLTRESVQKTGVNVVYERTALTPEANEHVRRFAEHDSDAGQKWEQLINAYFEQLRGEKKQ